MQRNTKKTLKPKIYATKSKNFKQIPKTLKNLQHLCNLERYLITYYVISQTITISGKGIYYSVMLTDISAC